MTVIEFFDRESPVENMISTLLCKPDKVIFIGDSTKKILRSIEKYKIIAEKREIDVEFEAVGVGKNNLMAIVGAIEDVLSENDDCVIDLTAGDDLFLVAVGIVYCDNADKIKLHRFNISNNKMIDCDSDGVLCAAEPMTLSVEEIVALNGGRVIFESEKGNATHRWDFNREFMDDIYLMWSVCRRNPTNWNIQINLIEKLCGVNYDNKSLSVRIDVWQIKEILGENSNKISFLFELLEKLYDLGILNDLKITETDIYFSFKNSQVKKCLTKAGLILELVVAVMSVDSENENGTALYNDVMTGVFIDWDGEVQPECKADVENEMDVILMKGMIPVFISCKNGLVSIDELYKLSVVADKFGGRYVRKVLLTSELEKAGHNEAYIKARAESMGIKIVDKVDELSEDVLKKKIKNLWLAD